MSINTALKALAALLVVLLVVAFTPLAEGKSGSWQNTVGNIVWSAIFLAVAGLVITAILGLIGPRRDGRRLGSS